MGSRMVVAVAVVVVGLAIRATGWKGTVLVVFLLAGVASGALAEARLSAVANTDLPEGHRTLTLTIVEEASRASWGLTVAEVHEIDGEDWDDLRVAIRDLDESHDVGSILVGSGTVSAEPRWVRGEPVAGTVARLDVRDAILSRNPVVRAGNAVRDVVQNRYNGDRRPDGLLRGFLIGDTDLMRASDAEDLRRAGLSHFVAVSGSNVALFLAVWWLVTAPLSIHPQFRVLVGGIGLWLFAVVTRWESSVIRASAMAAVPLVGGWVGIPVDPWMALGTAVGVLLLVSGHLVGELGFQLSVAATAGVLMGIAAVRGRRPRWLLIPLAATVGAQLMVAPLLLVTFGSVPLFAPLANLIAAPVVAGTTIASAVGVAIAPVAAVGRAGGSVVLFVAEVFAGGPQLGWIGVGVVVAIGAGAWHGLTRPVALAVGGLLLATVVGISPSWPNGPVVTVLDVGQGDAILIQDVGGSSLLFDGGSDPTVLERALRRNGVGRVQTVVVSHGDADHVGGLGDLIAGAKADLLIVSEFVHDDLPIVSVANDAGVHVATVAAGDRLAVGDIPIRVLSPQRRFQSDNDGSVVLLIESAVSVLLPGDAEAIALAELPEVQPDVLVVPHHGSSSTDVSWLASTRAPTAILSYGPNRYGHPHPDILATLDSMGATVLHTANEGDVRIPLE